jgi:hypothetical protein
MGGDEAGEVAGEAAEARAGWHDKGWPRFRTENIAGVWTGRTVAAISQTAAGSTMISDDV